MDPTPEQKSVLDAFTTGESVKIAAGAGAGKTSTLRLLAQSAPRRRGLYMAFNKAIATDAQKSFPRSVTVKTTHALAFASVGRKYRHRLTDPRQPYTRMADTLGITDKLILGEKRALTAAQQARMAETMVTNYCNSADNDLGVGHLPPAPGLDPEDWPQLGAILLPHAQAIWQDWTAVNGNRFQFRHDAYLKMFALRGGNWGYDYLLFDEAQDTVPVVSRMVAEQQTQGAQVVVVGDSAQAIYGWRGAVSAMDMFRTRHSLQLSQSFRFGPAVASEANKWLRFLHSPMTLRGFDQLQSVVTDDEITDSDAILCRSNAGTIRQVMLANEQGRRVAIVGGGDDALRLAEAAADLMVGKPTKHPELSLFPDWRAVQEYVEEEGGGDLRPFVQLIDEYTPPVIMRAIKQTVPEAQAERVISTAHKAKGREWLSVQIDDDFQAPRIDYATGEIEVPPAEEAMLAYVAVTRARKVLGRGSLAWIDEHVPGAVSRVTSLAAVPAPEQPDPTPSTTAVKASTTRMEPWETAMVESLPVTDREWLQAEAARRGVTLGEVVGRLVAAQRMYATPTAEASKPRAI